MKKYIAIAAALLASAVWAVPAQADDQEIARRGDVIAGRNITGVSRSSINDAGVVAFQAGFTSATQSGSGIFLWDSVADTYSLAIGSGDTLAGRTLYGAGMPALNDSGQLVFVGSYAAASGATAQGIFSMDLSTGSGSLLLEKGDSIGGHTLTALRYPAVNDAGTVLFEDNLRIYSRAPSTGSWSVLVEQGTVIDGWRVNQAKFPSINDAGEVVFLGIHTLSGTVSPIYYGIFSLSAVLQRPGDVIDGHTLTGGDQPAFADGAGPVFAASTAPLAGSPGIFSLSEALVLPGDEVAGQTISVAFLPSMNDAGHVVFLGVSNGQVLLFRDGNRNPNTDPSADAGADKSVSCSSSTGTSVSLDGSGSTDADGDPLSYEWSVPQGSGATLSDPTSATPTGIFPVGVTLVTLTVRDGRGGEDLDDVEITVVDETPPAAACTTDVIALGPPNHNMIEVEIILEASDACADAADLSVTCQVSSNEADDATGDGNFTGDVNGEDGHSSPVSVTLAFDATRGVWAATISLRAERDGRGSSRIYSILCQVTDTNGNSSQASCVVVVSHDRRKS